MVDQKDGGHLESDGQRRIPTGLRTLIYPALYVRRRWRRWLNAPALRAWTNLSSSLAEDPVVNVPSFAGTFAIGARSDLLRRLMLTGSYEPGLVDICRAHVDPRRDAIDVGANIGLYTVLLAKLLPGRRVLAVEPTPAALARLRRNLEINGLARQVEVYGGAAGATGQIVQMHVVTGREEYSTAGELVHPSVAGANFDTMNVPGTTIDALVSRFQLTPGFIKIDVEGTEHAVLAGMMATIRSFRPVILAELSDPLLKRNGSSAREVIEVLRREGYALTDPLAPGMPAGKREFGDLLCIPSG